MRLRSLNCTISSAVLALAVVCPVAVLADEGGVGANVYIQTNIISDISGMATHTDTRLMNPWGIEHSPSSPWWVNTNGTGLSIVYDANGNPAPAAKPVVVTIPGLGGGTGTPTGIVFNGSMDFQLGPALPALFLFATEDGTIAGWNPMVNASMAITKVTTPNAVYKGLTLGMTGGHNVIYAANFRAGTVDVFDTNFHTVTLSTGAFKDTSLPPGYAPFNVQNVNGSIYVTFALQDDAKHDDVPGAGNGYVDRFSSNGQLMMRLEHGPWLNSPWAVVATPDNFGKLSDKLLVGNFGSGQIAAYNADSGKFMSMMMSPGGSPVTIDGLWGLKFGNGATAGPTNVLFFAAGINGEADGLFGSLAPGGGAETDDDNNNGEHGHNNNGNNGNHGGGNGDGGH